MVEVDALSGSDRHSPDHVGELSLALGAQHRDHLQLGHACRQALSYHSVEKDVRRVAEDLRTENGERHARGCHQHHEDDADPLRPQSSPETPDSVTEVLRSLNRHGHPVPARSEAPSRCRALPRRRGAHAACSPSCDVTISRYSGQLDKSSSWGPIPTMRPSSRTMIRSACRIVLTR